MLLQSHIFTLFVKSTTLVSVPKLWLNIGTSFSFINIVIILLSIAVLLLLILLLRSKLELFRLQQVDKWDDEHRFKTLYNKSPVMMHSIDLEGRLVFVNDYWLKKMGYTRAEVIGRTSESFFSGSIRENYNEIFNLLLKDAVINNFDAKMIRKDGSSIYVSLTAELHYDKKGSPYRASTVMMDITERKKAVDQLKESKHKLDSILNNAREAIFILQDERIKFSNKAATKVLGYGVEDLNYTSFTDIIHEDDKKQVVENYYKRMRGENIPSQYSFRILQKNGKIIWVEINAVYLLWDKKPAILIFLIDITERRKHETMLAEQTTALKKQHEFQVALNKELNDKNEALDNSSKELKKYAHELKNAMKELDDKNKALERKNKVLDEHQEELEDYADELTAALEEVDVKNKRIEQAHTDMMDSIGYAKIIQEAVLKTSDEIKTVFDHFIIYQPKDIVSGDFFFIKKIGELYLFALGDCTGHGVPGGFLTMLSVNLIQETIAISNIKKPEQILETIREKLKQVFHYSRHHDGMDLALCVYDRGKKELTYTGANMPAIVIRDGIADVFKPVFNPVGYYIQEHPFKSQTIKVKENDVLYLYSDGFKDQFGGTNQKKYQSRRLNQLLENNCDIDMDKQKQMLIKEFNDWKGNEQQLDDVTLMGIRLQ